MKKVIILTLVTVMLATVVYSQTKDVLNETQRDHVLEVFDGGNLRDIEQGLEVLDRYYDVSNEPELIVKMEEAKRRLLYEKIINSKYFFIAMGVVILIIIWVIINIRKGHTIKRI